MGKKAVIGIAPKDSAIDKMDRYIQRNDKKEQQYLHRNGKKDLSKIPFNEWPLKKQMEHMDNKSDIDIFKEQYSSYSTWYEAVKKQSGVYPGTFVDWTSANNVKEVMKEMHANNTPVKSAVNILKTDHGIY
jgi:hypothetical protein